MSTGLYENYWQFLEVRGRFGDLPRPVVQWWDTKELCELDRLYLNFLSDRKRVLDYGAGDLRYKKKFQANGLNAKYFTCDFSQNYQYDFHSIEEIIKKGERFDAILILEVIEHLTLEQFKDFFPKLLSVLEPGGKIIVSTPNAQALNATWATDMTHVQTYPLPDLWALLTLRGFECKPYRVLLRPVKKTLRWRVKLLLAKVITRILGVDYATGVAVLGSTPQ